MLRYLNLEYYRECAITVIIELEERKKLGYVHILISQITQKENVKLATSLNTIMYYLREITIVKENTKNSK